MTNPANDHALAATLAGSRAGRLYQEGVHVALVGRGHDRLQRHDDHPRRVRAGHRQSKKGDVGRQAPGSQQAGLGEAVHDDGAVVPAEHRLRVGVRRAGVDDDRQPELGELVEVFLGPGDWNPRPKTYQRRRMKTGSVAPPAFRIKGMQ